MDVGQQRDPGAVEEAGRDHQVGPVVQRLVEAVGMFELVGLPPVYEVLLRLSNVLEQPVCDVRVGQFVLDDGVRADLSIGRWRVPGCHPIGRSTHQLRVGLDRELDHECLTVALGHLLDRLDDVALLDLRLEFVFRERRHSVSCPSIFLFERSFETAINPT